MILKISLDLDMQILLIKKYGIRDYRGGGRSFARETAIELLQELEQKGSTK